MPRERVTKIMVYDFDELSERAKDKVIDHLYYVNVDYEWWCGVYEDAENAGIKIYGFDIDRGSYCTISFISGAEESAYKIIDEHGMTCDTYKTAKAYIEERNKLIEGWPRDAHGELEDEYELDDKLDDLDSDFKKAIAEDYLSILKKEYEYLTSKEAILGYIEASNYEFDEEGNIV